MLKRYLPRASGAVLSACIPYRLINRGSFCHSFLLKFERKTSRKPSKRSYLIDPESKNIYKTMLSPEIFPSTNPSRFPLSALPSPCSSGPIAPPWGRCASGWWFQGQQPPGRDGNMGHLKRSKTLSRKEPRRNMMIHDDLMKSQLSYFPMHFPPLSFQSAVSSKSSSPLIGFKVHIIHHQKWMVNA